MSKTSVPINPGDAADALPVLGHLVNDIFVPIYSIGIGAEGEDPTLVTDDDRMPVDDGSSVASPKQVAGDVFIQLLSAIKELSIQQEITNEHLSRWSGEKIKPTDFEIRCKD